MVTMPEILAVMKPNRGYSPQYLSVLIEHRWRLAYPNDFPRSVGPSIRTTIKRMVETGRLRNVGPSGYALPLEPPAPKRKKRKAKPKARTRCRVLKPPSVLYRARRMGLA